MILSTLSLFAIGRNLKVLQDSTRGPAKILSAIADKKSMKAILDSESYNMARNVQMFTYFMRDDYCNKCVCQVFSREPCPGCLGAQARLQMHLLNSGERMAILDRNFFEALHQVVSAISAMPTVRTVIFISDGFNRFPGRELDAVLDGFSPQDHQFEFNP